MSLSPEHLPAAPAPAARLAARVRRPVDRVAARLGLRALGGYLLLVALVVLTVAYIVTAPLAQVQRWHLDDDELLAASGFYPTESSDYGYFRWSEPDASLRLPLGATSAELMLRLRVPPAQDQQSDPAYLRLGEQAAVALMSAEAPRTIRVFVPGGLPDDDMLDLRLSRQVLRIGTDERPLGVGLFGVAWQSLGSTSTLWAVQTAAIGLAALLLVALLRRAGLGWLPTGLTLLLFCLITLAMRHSDPRPLYRWHAVRSTLAISAVLAAALVGLRWLRPAAGQALNWSGWWRRHRWPLATFTVLTIGFFQPYLSRLRTHVFGGLYMDNLEYTWKLWWFSEALVRRHSTAAWTPELAAPFGFEMARAEMTPAHTLLGLPLTLLLGAPTTYNLLILLSTVLSAFCAYLLAERLTEDRMAGLVAGTLFGFCFYRTLHLGGHLPLMGTQWTALAFYGWIGVLRYRRAWDAFVAGLGVALTAWSSWYYAPILVILLALFTLVLLPYRQPRLLVSLLGSALVAGGITLALVLPFAQPSLELRSIAGETKHSFDQLLASAATVDNLLYPNFWHPLVREWIGPYLRFRGENLAVLGYAALLFGLIGLWVQRRQRMAWAWAAVIAASVLMALGPYIRVTDSSPLTIPGPVLWFYQSVPVLDSIRIWSRMTIFATLGLAVLAAMGLSRLRLPRRPVWVGLVLVLAFFESIPHPLGMADITARPVEQWLSRQPDRRALMYFPDVTSPANQFFSSESGRSSLSAYGTFIPRTFFSRVATLRAFPAAETVALLQRWDTGYVVVNKAEMQKQAEAGWQATFDQTPGIAQVYADERHVVYQVLD